MAKLLCAMLALGFLESIGAAPEIPPTSVGQLAIGFAGGFVSDGPELTTCVKLAVGEGVHVAQALIDFKKGITSLNVTEMEESIKELKDAIDGVPTAEKTCKTVVADLRSVLGALKKINGPKDLIVHIVAHLFHDSEKIFAELAAAEHAYKTGVDYMTAGQQLGMFARRVLIGEGGDSPPPAPAPPAAKRELFEGVAVGFISDNLDFMKCSTEIRTEGGDFEHAIEDFAHGIRHLNLTAIKAAVEEFEIVVKGAAGAKASCEAAVVAVETDVKAIVSALKQIHGPKDLVLKVIDHFSNDGEDIFGEVSAASKAYGMGEYMGSGRQLGMAFRRMLVGEPHVTKIQLLGTPTLIV